MIMDYALIQTRFNEIKELELLLEATETYDGGLLQQGIFSSFRGHSSLTTKNMRDEFLPIPREEIIQKYKNNISAKITQLKLELEKDTGSSLTMLDVVEQQ